MCVSTSTFTILWFNNKNVSNFQQFEVVARGGSETQLQVAETFNETT